MDIATHVDELHRQGRALADVAERAGLDAEVPTCPPWTVRSLLEHVGVVHRWAATFVREGLAATADGKRPHLAEAPLEGLVEWFREGHSALVDELRHAPDDLQCWTFLPAPSDRAFWARRQAHETAIHRADADSAFGRVPSYHRDFALDGIAELLTGFYGRRGGKLLADPPCSLLIAPTDASTCWRVELFPDRRVVTRDDRSGADCELAGAASDLYLYLWNRPPAGEVSGEGDARVTEIWRRLATVTWS